jgi:phosphatidylglycerol:prolipoprotein diacylglycerol transferase
MIQYPGFNKIAFEIGPVNAFGHELGPIQVHWYGIMYLLGFAAAWWLARRRAKQPNSTWAANEVDDLIFYCMLGVILGGRIGYVLFYGMKYWRTDLWYPFKITEGGMSFHGGMLGVIAAMMIFAWRRKRAMGDVFDFTVPLPALGLLFGRLGNFINSELWGKTTTVPWGFNVNGEVRHASQLYEAFFEGIVLFAIIWWYTSRARPRYAASGLFLIVYGIVRFGIEFVRVPDEHIGYLAGGWFTMGQLLSLPMIFGGIALMLFAYRRAVPTGNLALSQ